MAAAGAPAVAAEAPALETAAAAAAAPFGLPCRSGRAWIELG